VADAARIPNPPVLAAAAADRSRWTAIPIVGTYSLIVFFDADAKVGGIFVDADARWRLFFPVDADAFGELVDTCLERLHGQLVAHFSED
jgi:hypothetical protein